MGKLIETIWRGDLVVRGADEMSPLAHLLDALLVVPVVSLVSQSGFQRPVAFAQGVEVMPGAPLGDVLAEELGVEVSDDAIVLIEPKTLADASTVSGDVLGRELGKVLVSLASLPLDALMGCPGRPDASPEAFMPPPFQSRSQPKFLTAV